MQTVEEVADVIAAVIEKPVAEVYTNPASADMARRYFADVGAFEAGPRWGPVARAPPVRVVIALLIALSIAALARGSASAAATTGLDDPREVQPERPTVATHAGTVAADISRSKTGVERDQIARVDVALAAPIGAQARTRQPRPARASSRRSRHSAGLARGSATWAST